MKLNLGVAGSIFLGLVTASPLQNPDDSAGLQASKERHDDKDCRTIHVQPGQLIQDAINAASRGDRILVEAGTYAEQLTIEKDGIALVGLSAILAPPTTAVTNHCSNLTGPGTEAGICVMGYEIDLAPFLVEHRKVLSAGELVKDVLITGFQVSNFSGANIAVVGAQNARASNNHLSEHNVALCVQTPGANVQYNDVSDSYIGVFVDPSVDGVMVSHNHVSATNPSCRQLPTDVAFGTYGIILDGAINAKVWDNLIERQTNGGLAAGLAIIDDSCINPDLSLSCSRLRTKAVASANVVVQNILRDNDLDLFVNTTGTSNTIACNKCLTPKELCLEMRVNGAYKPSM
ncbi:pectin lyase fold/virulence factor [Ilyonectria sp. MPI-CAGE-AT-0026]|nr:pectin lyase fold/virulence factor [Ilyonectria sp. MPI-CAGE-AT-0026]